MHPSTLIACFALLVITTTCRADDPNSVWIDPAAAASENPDFMVQGEYAKDGAKYGVQVVALGMGTFDAYILEGGLPGAGWQPGMARIRISGARSNDTITFNSAETSIKAEIKDSTLILHAGENEPITLPRIQRLSPTLGINPPADAVVLFDGSSADTWERGIMENGLLKANHSTSKSRFKSYTAHIEFRTPFKPKARSQKRGNSGIYHAGRWETQILDSFGLDGKDNECGGIYSISKPRLNMCLPPLTWQTYDVDFTAASFDETGKRTAWPRITVKLNGVLIHDNLELSKDYTTAAPTNTPLSDEPAPMFLQDHKNPVYFRNIWMLPR